MRIRKIKLDGINFNSGFNTSSLYSKEEVEEKREKEKERIKKIVGKKIEISESGFMLDMIRRDGIALGNTLDIVLDRHCLDSMEFSQKYPREFQKYVSLYYK